MTIQTKIDIPAPPAKRSLRAVLKHHQPVIATARNRFLKYSGSLIDGIGCIVVSTMCGVAHTIGSAHGLADGWPSWTSGAWWVAYVSAWIMFVAGASQSLLFGIALVAAYFTASLVGVSTDQLATLMLLAVTAVGARAVLVIATIAQDVARKIR